MSPAAPAERSTRPGVAIDLALTGVSVAVVLTLIRLFTTTDFLPRLLLSVVLAHLIAASLRRTRLPAGITIVGSVVLGAIVLTQLYLRDTTAFGLPTATTFVALGEELESAFAPFRTLVAPVDGALGFQLTLAIAMWVTATFADAALGRADAPIQAVTPTIAVFLFGSVLTRGDRVVPSTLVVAAALALLWLAVLDRRGHRQPWVRGDRAEGLASTRAWGMASLAVAFVAVASASPLLPVSSTDAAIDLRRLGQRDGPQVVDSPLVGLTSLLGERSNEEMFTVESTSDHYWRLTALDDFDGDTWSSRRRYRDIDGGSNLIEDPSAGSTVSHTFRIQGLQSSWLPVAYQPTSVEIDQEVRYDDESGSLLVSNRTAAGLTYRVDSLILDPVGAPRRSGLDRVDEAAYALPAGLGELLSPRASAIVGDADTALDQALRLERFFRDETNGFVYDERVDYRGETVPTIAFLDARAGFCQQYAGTFAALARSLGLPARVAVGFTFGEAASGGSERVVRGRHAHAWPEVFIEGRGWLAFEPTPGRGNPDAESYTERPAQQNDGGSGAGGSSDVTSTTEVVPPTTVANTQPPATDENSRTEADTTTPATAPDRPWWQARWFLIAVGISLAALITALARWAVVRRRRRHRTDAGPHDRVRHAWTSSCHDLRTVGFVALPSESPPEFASRAAAYAGQPIIELGALESERRYRPDPLQDDEADRADAAAEDIRAAVVSSLGRVDRVRFELDLPRR